MKGWCFEIISFLFFFFLVSFLPDLEHTFLISVCGFWFINNSYFGIDAKGLIGISGIIIGVGKILGMCQPLNSKYTLFLVLMFSLSENGYLRNLLSIHITLHINLFCNISNL